MKKIVCLLSIVFPILFLSCSTGEEGPDPSPVVNAMSQGTWRVTEYTINNNVSVSETFAAYTFTFAAGDVLTATNGIGTYTGNWSVRNFDNERLKFVIGFDGPEPFTYLTNSWRIRSRSASKIVLDINEFNYIVFEKND